MKPIPAITYPTPSIVEHHYHGTVIHRHEAPRSVPVVRTREMGTQTDEIEIVGKAIESVEAPAAPPIKAALSPDVFVAARKKWHQRVFDALRSWFNRNRYIFELALNVVIFLFNRVNIGISLRPDSPR